MKYEPICFIILWVILVHHVDDGIDWQDIQCKLGVKMKKGDYLCHKRRYSDARIVGTRQKYMRGVASWEHIEAMLSGCRNIVPLVVGGSNW